MRAIARGRASIDMCCSTDRCGPRSRRAMSAGFTCRSMSKRCAPLHVCSSASTTSRRFAPPSVRRRARYVRSMRSRSKAAAAASTLYCARTPSCITWCAISSARSSMWAKASICRTGWKRCCVQRTVTGPRRRLPPKGFTSSGSNTMRAGDCRVRTRVKICGITRPADARAAAEAGADAIGLVFYPQSPRFLAVERAVEIRDALPPFVQAVALFVNPDAAQVAQVLGRLRPAALQFHGEESPQFCGQFGVPWIKAARVKSGVSSGVDLLEYLRPFSGAMAWLLDSHVEAYGGVGESFDWSVVPAARDKPLILSG